MRLFRLFKARSWHVVGRIPRTSAQRETERREQTTRPANPRTAPPHSRMSGTTGLVFRQLFEKESSTYTYLLADAETKEVRDSAGQPRRTVRLHSRLR